MGVDSLQKLQAQRQTLVSALDAAKKTNDQAQINAAKIALFDFDQEHPDVKGIQVEPNPNDKPLTPAQKARKEKIQQQELAQKQAMKEVSQLQEKIKNEQNPEEKARLEGELAKAQAHLDEISRPITVRRDGVETGAGVIDTDIGEKSSSVTFNLSAPTAKKEKTTKAKEKQEMSRYYDKSSGTTIEAKSDSKEDLKAHKAVLKDKKADMKAEIKTAKTAAKGSGDEFKAAFNEFDEAKTKHELGQMSDAEYDAAAQKFQEAFEKFNKLNGAVTDAKDEYAKIKQSYKAAKGRGIGGDTRAENANTKANNRLVDRQVYYTEEEANKAIEAGADKKNVRVASSEDLECLAKLQNKAKQELEKAETLKSQNIWNELANMLVDENGKPNPHPDYKKVQNALIDITGGDMRLNYTEQQIVAAETGMSMSQVRHLFQTYGFEAPNPLGKRVVNGLKEAAPVALTMGLSALLTRSKSKAVSEATDTQTATATSEVTKTVVAEDVQTAKAFAEVWTSDRVEQYVDKFGRTRDLRIAGEYASDTQTTTAYAKAVATATAKAQATATAFASATAIVEATAKLSPVGLVAAPVLAFFAGFAKPPVENSATKNANTEKMASFIEVFKHNKNKNIGNQIIQMVGQISGDPALDKALVVAVLDNDIGSQNTTPTTRELRAALDHLKAIKREVDNMKTIVENPPVPPEEPSPEPEIHKDVEVRQEKVANFKFDVLYAGPDSYIEACYGVKKGTPEFKAIQKELYEQNPGLKGNNYKLGVEIFMPTVTVDGKEFAPDLQKRPKKGAPGAKNIKYKGNDGTREVRDEWYGPGKTHTHEHEHMTKEEAERRAREELEKK